ncbi:BA75_02116T0 [Komagataella pastoris]|uniref:BA75_02116T0 n=1 Tax=Komagataella pastoris TaxID=4922 RepID=A0A1B2JA82_PICPA|nr:BA75_02116T0 [Komagataella pastoris]
MSLKVQEKVHCFDALFYIPESCMHRGYRLIQLRNGLIVLLVSDPLQDVSACSLTVATGAHDDPCDLPGLAHLCEHMLLLGTKKYPQPDHFYKLISRLGGTQNATTTGETTSFYFETPSGVTNDGSPIIDDVLDVFSQFFKEPLFNRSNSSREILAVNNEHINNKTINQRLMYHGLRLLSSRSHPFHRFATGNTSTLLNTPKARNINVRERLLKFHAKNYKAVNMSLVLKGPQSLNAMQKLVMTHFIDGIPGQGFPNGLSLTNLHINQRKWNYKHPAFGSTSHCDVTFINRSIDKPWCRLHFPVGDDHLLSIFWVHIYGDESPNSICDMLKQEKLITSLTAYPLTVSAGEVLLTLEMKITTNGAKRISQILSILFSFTEELIKKDLKDYLRSIISLELFNYLNSEEQGSSMDEVHSLSLGLLNNFANIGPNWIIRQQSGWNSLYERHKSGTIDDSFHKLLRKVRFNNCKLIFIGKKIYLKHFKLLNIKFDQPQTDPYFDFEYCLGSSSTSPDMYIPPTISFPIVNTFLPAEFHDPINVLKLIRHVSLIAYKSPLSFFTKAEGFENPIPTQVENNAFHQLWFRKTNNEKNGIVSLDMAQNKIPCSSSATIFIDIICELLAGLLKKRLYEAELLGVIWTIYPSVKGDCSIGLTVSGFTETLDEVFKAIINQLLGLLTNLSTFKDEYIDARVAVRTRYEGLKDQNSITLATAGLIHVIEENTWTIEERLEKLEEITKEELKNFFGTFFGSPCSVSMLYEGMTDFSMNYSQLLNTLTKHRDYSGDHNAGFKCLRRSYLLNTGNYAYYKTSNDATSAISYFVQTGLRSDVYNRTLTKVVSFLLSLYLEPKLRTEEQLGYIVMGSIKLFRATTGICISVMSSEFEVEYLHFRIKCFLEHLYDMINRMTKDEFKAQILNPMLTKIQNDTSSSKLDSSSTIMKMNIQGISGVNEPNRLALISHKSCWEQISSGTYNFCNYSFDDFIDTYQLEILDKCGFVAWFKSKFLDNEQQLSIMIKSEFNKGQLKMEMLTLRLSAFLNAAGLRITDEDLEHILKKSNAEFGALIKLLVKHFKSRSLKLTGFVVHEMMKTVTYSLNKNGKYQRMLAKRIENIGDFHSSLHCIDYD